MLCAGLASAAFSVHQDISSLGKSNVATGVFVLLGIALLIALGFEFVNGFHDTTNAVATVICTHSLPPLVAVVRSGFFNVLGAHLLGRRRLHGGHAVAGPEPAPSTPRPRVADGRIAVCLQAGSGLPARSRSPIDAVTVP
jgi:hypothetical protein